MVRDYKTPLLTRPDDEGKDLVPAIKIAFEEGDLAVALDQFAPFLRVIEISLDDLFGWTAAGQLTDGSEGVEVGINEAQLFVVMSVGVLVVDRIVGVIHAGAEIGVVKDLILMI